MSSLGNHVRIRKAKAGRTNKERAHRYKQDVEKSYVLQGRDIEREIDELTSDKQGAYWNKMHPNHNKVVNQVLALRELLTQ